MAKRSNKTEQVLRLITKEDKNENEQKHSGIKLDLIKKEKEAELKYETKLKIEIEPEIKVKTSNSSILEENENLVNLAELLAKEQLSLVMKRMNVCSCQTCTNDILALALNSLPTKYVTTDAGKQFLQLEIYKKQYETDVLAALTRACVRVKACPRH